MDVLKSECAELAQALSQYPNVIDIDDGFQPGKHQIDFQIKPKGIKAGLSPYDIAKKIRYAYYGAQTTKKYAY